MSPWTKAEILEALREELAIWNGRAEREKGKNYPSERFWEGNASATERAIELIERMAEDAA